LLIGDHVVAIDWTAPRGAGLVSRPDLIDLGMPASNIRTSISLPEDRWSLVMLGQGAGTVVLYWGELAIFALVALLLSLWSRSPLPFRDWLLLGLGLSTLSWPVFAVVSLWLLVMRWRQDWQHDALVYWRFDIAQRYQELDIQVGAEGRDLLVRTSRMRGTEIKMVVTGIVGTRAWNHLFEGQIEGGRIAGRLSISDGNQTRAYPWMATRQ